MEYIDVLDENGVKTGEILSRREIHKRGLWHRAIVVAVINEKNEISELIIGGCLGDSIFFLVINYQGYFGGGERFL